MRRAEKRRGREESVLTSPIFFNKCGKKKKQTSKVSEKGEDEKKESIIRGAKGGAGVKGNTRVSSSLWQLSSSLPLLALHQFPSLPRSLLSINNSNERKKRGRRGNRESVLFLWLCVCVSFPSPSPSLLSLPQFSVTSKSVERPCLPHPI